MVNIPPKNGNTNIKLTSPMLLDSQLNHLQCVQFYCSFQVLLEEFSKVFGTQEQRKGETQHELRTDSQLSQHLESSFLKQRFQSISFSWHRTLILLLGTIYSSFLPKHRGRNHYFCVRGKHLQINSSITLVPSRREVLTVVGRIRNLYLLAVEYLLSCENSKYYLSLKFNTVLLPETTLYSVCLGLPSPQADGVSYTGTSSGIYI